MISCLPKRVYFPKDVYFKRNASCLKQGCSRSRLFSFPVNNRLSQTQIIRDQFRPFATIAINRNLESRSIIRDVLNANSLQALFQKQIYAIVIPNFLDSQVCSDVSKKLLSEKIQEYTNAPGIGRIGISFYETTHQPEMKKKYFETAISNIESLRKIFSPYLSPMDHLRLTLDEAWAFGCNLSVQGNRKMFAGLCRALEEGKGILPHEDKLERDAMFSRNLIKAQAAANLYLQTPEKGGALELYSQSLSTQKYDSLRGTSYGIDRSRLPPPVVTIKPSDGDLVIFNSRRLHAVTDSVGKTRVSISCFIGFNGANFPLKVWS